MQQGHAEIKQAPTSDTDVNVGYGYASLVIAAVIFGLIVLYVDKVLSKYLDD